MRAQAVAAVQRLEKRQRLRFDAFVHDKSNSESRFMDTGRLIQNDRDHLDTSSRLAFILKHHPSHLDKVRAETLR